MPGTTSTAMPAAHQRLDLLAAAAEHQRIAALQPHHALAGARQRHQALVDLVLRHAVIARAACRHRCARRRAAPSPAPRARPAGRRPRHRRAAAGDAPSGSGDRDRRDRRRPDAPCRGAGAVVARAPSSSRISSRRAAISSPASASSPTRPCEHAIPEAAARARLGRACGAPGRGRSRRSAPAGRSRPARRARSRRAACRASAGAAPPVEMAMVIGARSTIAGMMKLESAGRSTTLTGRQRCLRGLRHARLQLPRRRVATIASAMPARSASSKPRPAQEMRPRRSAGRSRPPPSRRSASPARRPTAAARPCAPPARRRRPPARGDPAARGRAGRLCITPPSAARAARSSARISGRQEPQLVPARVTAPTASSVVAPSAIARLRPAAHDTPKQAQISPPRSAASPPCSRRCAARRSSRSIAMNGARRSRARLVTRLAEHHGRLRAGRRLITAPRPVIALEPRPRIGSRASRPTALAALQQSAARPPAR